MVLHPDEPKEKLESIAVQIGQSTAGKFVSDRGTRTIPQPHQEAATTETSTEGNRVLCGIHCWL